MSTKEDEKRIKYIKKQFDVLKNGWEAQDAMNKAKDMGLNPPMKIDYNEIVKSVIKATLSEYSQEGLSNLVDMVHSYKNLEFQSFFTNCLSNR